MTPIRDPPRPSRLLTIDDLFEVERRLGVIGRELGKLNVHVGDLVEGLKVRDHMDSQTDVSIHPNRLRLSFRGMNPWAVVAVVAIVALVLVLVLR